MSQAVLKITVDENPEAIVLKIEGRLAGPWVEELDRVWEQTSLGLKQRNLTLDLREITFADAGGIRTLRAIYSQTGASLLAGTPWTQYLAEEVGASSNAAVLEG
jgi:anti-anti-sigma regulatory factor